MISNQARRIAGRINRYRQETQEAARRIKAFAQGRYPLDRTPRATNHAAAEPSKTQLVEIDLLSTDNGWETFEVRREAPVVHISGRAGLGKTWVAWDMLNSLLVSDQIKGILSMSWPDLDTAPTWAPPHRRFTLGAGQMTPSQILGDRDIEKSALIFDETDHVNHSWSEASWQAWIDYCVEHGHLLVRVSQAVNWDMRAGLEFNLVRLASREILAHVGGNQKRFRQGMQGIAIQRIDPNRETMTDSSITILS